MVIIIGLIGLMVIGILLSRKYWMHEEVGVAIAIGSGVFLFLFLVMLPISHISILGDIEEFNSVRQTVDVARANGADIESAAIQHKIIEQNAWLAKAKFYNSTVFDLWVPDAVDSLEPIE
jgi:Zn-dependent protease